MSLRPSRAIAVSLALIALTGFRMPETRNASGEILYDVRGAFVTAQAGVSRDLITHTDDLVDASIQATTRSFVLPRTILTVRIGETRQVPVLFGTRHAAAVTVRAISVGSGEPVAEGAFEVSVHSFGNQASDLPLAEKIASRIVSEFRLQAPRGRSVVSALVDPHDR